MNIHWLKLDVNILNNEKIRVLRNYPAGDSLFVLWVGLLCLGMKSETPGSIYICAGMPYSDDDLAKILELPVTLVTHGLQLLQDLEMIEIVEGGIIDIISFEQTQSLEKIERIREQTRERVKQYKQRKRDNLKLLTGNAGNAKVTQSVTQQIRLDLDSDLDKDNKENDIQKDSISKNEFNLNSNTKTPRFTPPSVDDVEDYLKERRVAWREKWGVPYPSSITAEAFTSFYESRGWVVGKYQMKSWQAAVRTWEQNAIERIPELKKRLTENEYDSRISDSLTESELFELLNTCKNSKAGVQRINEMIREKRKARGL